VYINAFIDIHTVSVHTEKEEDGRGPCVRRRRRRRRRRKVYSKLTQ